jgi:hypothetical protein
VSRGLRAPLVKTGRRGRKRNTVCSKSCLERKSNSFSAKEGINCFCFKITEKYLEVYFEISGKYQVLKLEYILNFGFAWKALADASALRF